MSMCRIAWRLPGTMVLLPLVAVLVGCQTPAERWADASATDTRQAYLDYLDGAAAEPHITDAGVRLLEIQLQAALDSGDPERVRAFAEDRTLPHSRLKERRLLGTAAGLRTRARERLVEYESAELYAELREKRSIPLCRQYLELHNDRRAPLVAAFLAELVDETQASVRYFRAEASDSSKRKLEEHDYLADLEKLILCCTDLVPAPEAETDTPVLNIRLVVEQVPVSATYSDAGDLYTGFKRSFTVTARIENTEITARREYEWEKKPRGSIPVLLKGGKRLSDVEWSSWKLPERMLVRSIWSPRMRRDIVDTLLETIGPRHMLGKLAGLCALERAQPKALAGTAWPVPPPQAAWWTTDAAERVVRILAKPQPLEIVLPLAEADDWWIRKTAAWNLRHDPGPRATSVLLEMTDDVSPSVRMAAMCALEGRAGDEVTRALVRLLSDTSLRIREMAAEGVLRRGWSPSAPEQSAALDRARAGLGAPPPSNVDLPAEVVEERFVRLNALNRMTANLSRRFPSRDSEPYVTELRNQALHDLYLRSPAAFTRVALAAAERKTSRTVLPAIATVVWEQRLRSTPESADPLAWVLAFAPGSREKIVRLFEGDSPTLSGAQIREPTEAEQRFARQAIDRLGIPDRKGPSAGMVFVFTPEFLDGASAYFDTFFFDALMAAMDALGARDFTHSIRAFLPAPFGVYLHDETHRTRPWLLAAAAGTQEHPWPHTGVYSTVKGTVTSIGNTREKHVTVTIQTAGGATGGHVIKGLVCTALREGDVVEVGDFLGLLANEKDGVSR